MRFKVSLHPAFFLVLAASIFLGFWQLLLTAYAIVFVHELAHIIAARILGADVESVTVLPFGVCAKFCPSFKFTPKQDILISLAGPVVNLILAVVGVFLDLSFFTGINACLAIVNLLPALPLDGGRTLRSLLSLRWGSLRARNFTLIITRITTVLILIGGAVLLFVTKMNFSLLVIGAFLLTNWLFEAKNHAFSQMRGLLFSREKLADGVTGADHLVALDSFPARLVLRAFRWHRYYLVDVIDENSILLATLTETEIIDGLAKIGIRAKLRELF